MPVTRTETKDRHGRWMLVFESPESSHSYRIEKDTTYVFGDSYETGVRSDCYSVTRVSRIGQGWNIGRWLDLAAAEHVAYTLCAVPACE